MLETTTTQTIHPVSFTQNAVNEILRLMSEDSTKKYLRVGAKGGGCSGLSYVLEFDAPKERDLVLQIDNIPVVITPSQLLYIKGMEIDWSGGLNARGFTFKNPNASNTCGCGSSFGI